MPRGEPNQPEYANRLAALVHQHDRERQQEHRRGDDRHRGDGEMKPLEDDECAAEARGPLRRARHHARRARVQLACDVGGRIRIDERDIDAVHVLGALGLEVEIEKIGRCSRTSRGTLPSLAGSGVGS